MAIKRAKRICITVPESLLHQLDEYILPSERSELIADLLTDYVDSLIAEDQQIARAEARKEQMHVWIERFKSSRRKAAEMFLP